MKLICSKANLLHGVNIVLKAVPSKTTMSILECILIDASTNEIKFTANDMELGLDKFVKDKGYESAELSWNKKNVKIRLRALSYDIYLMKEGISTISAICEIIESKDYPYVVNLGEYEDDFSFVTILVNKKKFKKVNNADALFTYVSNCCAYYLLQDNDSPNEYKIEICDENTGEVLDSRTFNKKALVG